MLSFGLELELVCGAWWTCCVNLCVVQMCGWVTREWTCWMGHRCGAMDCCVCRHCDHNGSLWSIYLLSIARTCVLFMRGGSGGGVSGRQRDVRRGRGHALPSGHQFSRHVWGPVRPRSVSCANHGMLQLCNPCPGAGIVTAVCVQPVSAVCASAAVVPL